MYRISSALKYFVAGMILLGTFIPVLMEKFFEIPVGLTGKEILLWTIGGLVGLFLWLGGMKVTDPGCEIGD